MLRFLQQRPKIKYLLSPHFHGSRCFSLSSQTSVIPELAVSATANPKDPNSQLRLYQELNKVGYHGQVISRFEDREVAQDEACAREYIKALIALEQLNRLSFSKLSEILGGAGAGVIAQQYQLPIQANPQVSQTLLSSNNIHADFFEAPWTKKKKIGVFFKTALSAYLLLALWYFLNSFTPGDIMDKGPLGNLKYNHKQYNPSKESLKFKDVLGCDEARAELDECVAFLKNPENFTRLGGVLPKGVLLAGPPGTGKTLLAKAMAGEAGVSFLYCSGSEFEEMFIGVGAKRIRSLFAAARVAGKCVIFIDEIDAVGGKRKKNDIMENRMTLNQLLVEMDGFDSSDGVIVVGATNLPDRLDPALTRAGRFDRRVEVPLPDQRGRKQILDHYLSRLGNSTNSNNSNNTHNLPNARNAVVGKDVDTAYLARGTIGMSGADLAHLVNTAALHAATKDKTVVGMADLEYAKDKILMGPERKSAVFPLKSRTLAAYHEGGHTLMAMFTEGAPQLHKATIMPRGASLGHTAFVLQRDEDMYSRTKLQMLADLDCAMGGRVAEELVFGFEEVTTGAGSDLANATSIARNMVLRVGMGPRTGPRSLVEDDLETLSAETKHKVDQDIRELLQDSYERATKKLTSKRVELERLAQALLTYETLDQREIFSVVNGKPLQRAEL